MNITDRYTHKWQTWDLVDAKERSSQGNNGQGQKAARRWKRALLRVAKKRANRCYKRFYLSEMV